MQQEYIEIDLVDLFHKLMKHIWVIILVTVICGASTFAVSKYLITPEYESMSSMFMLTKETTLTSLADLQIGAQLTNDYKVIVTSRPVLQDVIAEIGLDMDYKELKKRLEIENPQNTRILTITIKDPSPTKAKQIVDTVAMVASEYIGDTMELEPPKIIETGEVATEKCSPSNGKNAAIGGLIGFIIICGIYVVQAIMNDAVTTAEDVEKYLGLTVLSSVPLRADAAKEKNDKVDKKDKKNKKKKRK